MAPFLFRVLNHRSTEVQPDYGAYQMGVQRRQHQTLQRLPLDNFAAFGEEQETGCPLSIADRDSDVWPEDTDNLGPDDDGGYGSEGNDAASDLKALVLVASGHVSGLRLSGQAVDGSLKGVLLSLLALAPNGQQAREQARA